MDRIALDIDCPERTGGTNILAAAATDADVLVDVRDCQAVAIGNHRKSLGRAMLGAGAAAGSVEMDDAVFFDKDHFAHLRPVLFLDRQGLDGAVGADIAADRAIVVAETFLEIDGGLHDALQTVFQERRLQDVRRAFAHAQMARGAALLEMRQADGTRRSDRVQPLVRRIAVVVAHDLRRPRHQFAERHRGREAGNQEAALRSVFHRLPGGVLRQLGQREGQGAFLATLQTIKAIHATRIVDGAVLAVDARCLATGPANQAVRAFVRIDAHLEERVFAQETEEGSHRADGVAPCPPVLPSQESNNQEGNQPDDERRKADDGSIDLIKGIIVETRENRFEQIVSQHIDRLEHIGHHPPERAVRLEQTQDDREAGQKTQHRNTENRPPQHVPGGRIAVAFLPLAPLLPFRRLAELRRQPVDHILENPHRTNNRAIDAPEQECDGQEDHQRDGTERNQRGHKLHLRQHGGALGRQYPGKIEEVERNQPEEHHRQGGSYLSQHKQPVKS